MTRREIASLACKILALWIFFQATFALSAAILLVALVLGKNEVPLGKNPEVWSALALGCPGVILAFIGLIFWFRADSMARGMVSDDPAPVTSSQIGKDGLLMIACAVIGVFLLIGAIPDLFKPIYLVIRSKEPFSSFLEDPGWVADTLADLLKLVLSLWLMLGARGLGRWILRFRSIGQVPPEDQAPPKETE